MGIRSENFRKIVVPNSFIFFNISGGISRHSKNVLEGVRIGRTTQSNLLMKISMVYFKHGCFKCIETFKD